MKKTLGRPPKINKKDLVKRMQSGESSKELAERYGVAQVNVVQMIGRMIKTGEINRPKFVGWYQKKGERKGEIAFGRAVKRILKKE